MTVDDEQTNREALIGPLTAAEWATFRLGHDDDPLYCCAHTSDVRDAIFHVLRMGGEAFDGAALRAVWSIVDDHDGLADHPLMRKLYDFYIDGQPPAPTDADVAEFLFAGRDPGFIDSLLTEAPTMWNMADQAAARTALGRLTGFLYVTPDAEQRAGYIRRVAALTGFTVADVDLVFDAFRGNDNLTITAPVRN